MWAGELHAASSLPAIPGSCDIKHSNLLVLTFIISPALDQLDFQKIKRNKTLLLTLNSLAFELGPCTKWRFCVISIQVTLRQKVWFSPKCIKISVNIYFSKNLDIHHFQRVNVRKEKYYYREYNIFTFILKSLNLTKFSLHIQTNHFLKMGGWQTCHYLKD